MILKKPYALLIKNFRKIHIILAILTLYIVYKSTSLVNFFSDFVINDYNVTITDNLAGSYIGPLLYLSIIIVVISLLAVYVLLRIKKKPNKIYLLAIVYYIILLIGLIAASGAINSLSEALWETAVARTYRDLSLIFYWPQFIFVVVILIRALGFNVKQFNFKNDLKELEITAEDSEEVELNLNFQTYKAKRTLRRFIREFKYYFKENKFIIFVLGLILVLALGFWGYKSYEKLEYSYKEGETFKYNNFSIKVINSMVSNLDMNGNVIYDDRYFVVIKFNIKNNTKNDKELDYHNLKLSYNNMYITPTLDMGSKFKDYGDPFMGDIIKSKSDNTYIMSYVIPKKAKDNDFNLVLYLGASSKAKDFAAKTAVVMLNPKRIGNVERIRTASLNDNVTLDSTALGNASITIKNAVFTTRYEYTYESCYKDSCRNYTDVVVSDNTYFNKQALVVMDYELNLDKSSTSYQNINDINAFASAFMQIEYTFGDETHKVGTKYVTPTKLKDKIVLQTDGGILNADSINLLITIRERCYVIKLK